MFADRNVVPSLIVFFEHRHGRTLDAYVKPDDSHRAGLKR
jgi:hypothetical protein